MLLIICTEVALRDKSYAKKNLFYWLLQEHTIKMQSFPKELLILMPLFTLLFLPIFVLSFGISILSFILVHGTCTSSSELCWCLADMKFMRLHSSMSLTLRWFLLLSVWFLFSVNFPLLLSPFLLFLLLSQSPFFNLSHTSLMVFHALFLSGISLLVLVSVFGEIWEEVSLLFIRPSCSFWWIVLPLLTFRVQQESSSKKGHLGKAKQTFYWRRCCCTMTQGCAGRASWGGSGGVFSTGQLR